MARRAVTPSERIANIKIAAAALDNLITRAVALPQGTPEAFAAWDAVEVHGATIHRQSRLLAGKAKGG